MTTHFYLTSARRVFVTAVDVTLVMLTDEKIYRNDSYYVTMDVSGNMLRRQILIQVNSRKYANEYRISQSRDVVT